MVFADFMGDSAIQEELSGGHLTSAQLVLQSNHINAIQAMHFVSYLQIV